MDIIMSGTCALVVLSPLFRSGKDFGPGDQHPQESALVIMVRVGDCGPGAWGTSFGVP